MSITQGEQTENGEYLTLAQVAKLIPREHGKAASYRSIMRWIHNGQCGVKLKSYKFGRHVYVKREDLDAFGAAVAAKSFGQLAPNVEVRRAIPEAVRRRLVANGLMKPSSASN